MNVDLAPDEDKRSGAVGVGPIRLWLIARYRQSRAAVQEVHQEEGQYNRRFVSVHLQYPRRGGGAGEARWRARRGADGRRYRATASDKRRLKPLVESEVTQKAT